MNCLLCTSESLTKVNTYKHWCYVCNDCNNVFHKKKSKYLLEWILPRALLRRVLPQRAFVRIFRADSDFVADDFYAVYADRCRVIDERARTEYTQLLDTLSAAGVDVAGKVVLDVSGGPGHVGKRLGESCKRAVVTEFSASATKAMSDVLGIETVTFDYNNDQLEDVVDAKFDLILLRSSIIFCEQLEELIISLRKVLTPNGHILVETIVPTLGEVFWWQQMEFKFKFIYSQETLEKLFYKHGFSLSYGQRDFETYFAVMKRQRQGFGKKLYTFGFEYPLLLAYYLAAPKKRVAIDTRLRHSMLTQVWQHSDEPVKVQSKRYVNYEIGPRNGSIHFGMPYNNYLRRDRQPQQVS